MPKPMTSDLATSESVEKGIATFLRCAARMLATNISEEERRQLEPLLIQQILCMHEIGLFDLFEIKDPALRSLVSDEIDAMQASKTSSRRLFQFAPGAPISRSA